MVRFDRDPAFGGVSVKIVARVVSGSSKAEFVERLRVARHVSLRPLRSQIARLPKQQCRNLSRTCPIGAELDIEPLYFVFEPILA